MLGEIDGNKNHFVGEITGVGRGLRTILAPGRRLRGRSGEKLFRHVPLFHIILRIRPRRPDF
jgi:hypothetical protein